MDYVNQRILARPPCWVLPLISYNPTVYRSRNGHGGLRQSPFGTQRPEYLWLGPLVPQDEGLRLHVHGVCSPEGQWHHQLLEFHLLHHSNHRACLHRCWTNNERGEERSKCGRERECDERENRVKWMCFDCVNWRYIHKQAPHCNCQNLPFRCWAF